jgi:dTDP-4-dehydrorhamnose reductase
MVDREVILVTGASGQLGTELRTASAAFPQYDFIFLSRDQLAIEDSEALGKVFSKQQPEYCINCAAYTAVDKAEAEKDLCFLVNATAVGLLGNACNKFGTKLIHISTDYVFNGQSTIPYKETDGTDPINVYGASKLEGERLAMEFADDSIIIRTSWVYSSYGKNFVNTMLRLMKEKKELSVVNDQFGAPTYAADLAHTILRIITYLSSQQRQSIQSYKGIYHYSNEGKITWYEFAQAIKEFTASSVIIHPITTAEFPTPAKRPAWSVLDNQKIIETFGVELPDWKESLRRCLATGQ